MSDDRWSIASRWVSAEEIEEQDAGQQELDLPKPRRLSAEEADASFYQLTDETSSGEPIGYCWTTDGFRSGAWISPVKIFSDRRL